MDAAAILVLILSALLIGGVILIFRQRRELQCLRYCWLDMSDWTARHLNEERAVAIDLFGDQKVPFVILENEKEWGKRVDYQAQIMKRNNVTMPTQEECDSYILGGL
jgi:hypothetical protein